ncbi:DUF2471 family protein [Burkholderia ambifaria]|uniref:DUF2471 family protein n=1 Tax=Burkholderia ambifaria TaxID=152480 RepID=UPI001588F042|nr:DUF2471 family protein [Burkholderia ambifaria]
MSTYQALLARRDALDALINAAKVGRNAAAVVDALVRISPATLPSVDFSGLVDWNLAATPLPIVYLCVRERLLTATVPN